jgi:hypothetical protein
MCVETGYCRYCGCLNGRHLITCTSDFGASAVLSREDSPQQADGAISTTGTSDAAAAPSDAPPAEPRAVEREGGAVDLDHWPVEVLKYRYRELLAAYAFATGDVSAPNHVIACTCPCGETDGLWRYAENVALHCGEIGIVARNAWLCRNGHPHPTERDADGCDSQDVLVDEVNALKEQLAARDAELTQAKIEARAFEIEMWAERVKSEKRRKHLAELTPAVARYKAEARKAWDEHANKAVGERAALARAVTLEHERDTARREHLRAARFLGSLVSLCDLHPSAQCKGIIEEWRHRKRNDISRPSNPPAPRFGPRTRVRFGPNNGPWIREGWTGTVVQVERGTCVAVDQLDGMRISAEGDADLVAIEEGRNDATTD